MPKTILVTGSSGTVGTALTLELINKGYHVLPMDIKPSLWNKQINNKTIRHDLRKPLSNQILRKKPDLIIHLAAIARVHDLVIDPQKALDNYIMTHNVLEYARLKGINNVVFASSREVYGESKTGKKRKEETTHVTQIKSPYTASKYSSEALIHSYHECYGIKPVIVRLSNVYGKYDVSERVIPFFIYQAKRNRIINIFGAEKKLDFTYIDDATDGLIRIVKRFDKVSGNTFNISRGVGAKILDVAKIIIKELNSESKIIASNKRVGEISSFVADLSLARKFLGYNPKIDVLEGVSKNIEWYLDVMKEKRVYNTQVRNLKKRGWA